MSEEDRTGADPAGGPDRVAPSRADAARARKTLLFSIVVVAAMVGLAYGAVPLYRVFCQVTGFAGTPVRAELSGTDRVSSLEAAGDVDEVGYSNYDTTGCPSVADAVAFEGVEPTDREIVVLFDANVDPSLPWDFRPMVQRMTVRVGEPQIMCFEAHNRSDQPITGTATFNVEPKQMGGYFVKIDCFCFEEQLLEPGQTMAMPVYFFVHADILENEEMRDQRTVTLSYTFGRDD